MTDFVFPLRQRPNLSYTGGRRYFGAPRPGRRHAGCDLIAPHGTEVLAMASGTIIRGPYEFYAGTYALEVQHDDGTIVRYGEISQDLPIGVSRGQRVSQGQVIAHVGRSTTGSQMLHLEMYSGTRRGSLTGVGAFRRRADLIDPTPYLESARLWQATSILRRGSRGPEVMDLQKRPGLKPDGIFGPQTHAAVMDFQRRNGLRVDGIVGPQTLLLRLPGTTSSLPQGIPPLGGGSLLRRGHSSPEVVDLQKRLGLKPDGVFGPKTEAAVKDFQRKNGLRVDGIVGPRTRGALTGGSSLMQQGLPPLGGSSLLRRGVHGPEVVDLQKRLGLKPDGIFGPQTHFAVMDFQRKNGLRVDGIVGPRTRGALTGGSSLMQQGLPPLGGSSLLRRGVHCPEVVDLQKRLGLKPDGIFGPQTHSAVMDFQRRNGLRVDGIVGPQTRGCFNNPLQMALQQLR